MGLRSLFFTVVQVAYDIVMKFNPRKLGAHAIIFDDEGRVLVLRSRYADLWQFPGGGVDRGEHLDAAVVRECREELGVTVEIEGLTGLHYYGNIAAYVALFRCRIVSGTIRLSHEHSDYRWAKVEELSDAMAEQVVDAYRFQGQTLMRRY